MNTKVPDRPRFTVMKVPKVFGTRPQMAIRSAETVRMRSSKNLMVILVDRSALGKIIFA
jgi:hypothetical protein